ncbi:hypothetical protein FACS1894111_04240 [Clostridia bacterium]|nr:hypothetical protein FACS1894111_04240 [Clostridia bacterium]
MADCFLEDYTFRSPWRNYQARILKEMSSFLSDDKINIVAAPGAGKTVLGLELVRRINKNVLILSPTITIKMQWVDRFLQLFEKDNSHDSSANAHQQTESPACHSHNLTEKTSQQTDTPDFISTDIYNLKRFNVATYQALHYAFNRKKINEQLDGEEEEPLKERAVSIAYDLIAELKKNHIEVVVLDEAHHLRSAWWKSLTSVLKELGDIKTISLTATPPYDAEKGEWERYLQVCGAIDSEITVPELVATGDLCPHQDFILFNSLLPEEEKQVTAIQGNLDRFVEQLKLNHDFISMLKNSPELTDYAQNEENVLENPRYYSSMLIFLHSIEIAIDPTMAKALGGGGAIPELTMEWLEILLQGILYGNKDNFAEHSPVIKKIHQDLNDIGAIVNGSVTLCDHNEIKKLMASSMGKMGSISDIVINEYSVLENDLSMVILADFVRSEALTIDPYNKMGVVPIFKRIVKDVGITPNDDSTVVQKICNIAILSGKLKVVPKTFVVLIKERLPACEFLDFPVSGYVQLKTTAKYENELVRLITDLMNEKKINIIIGTVALLGEGWDCQAVNSLILASVIGSFMLSNQMRGRAIRRDKSSDKVANI